MPDEHVNITVGVDTQAANQMTALVLTAPESTRAELRGLTPLKRARRAAGWRPGVGHDPVTVTRRAIRALARRWLDLTAEINTHNAELDELTAAGPSSSTRSAAVATGPNGRPTSSPPATTPTGSAPKQASPRCVASARSERRRARPNVTASTGQATAKPTTLYGPSPGSASAAIPRPAPTPIDANTRASRTEKSSAA
jgi:hypothetical protein